MQFIVHAEFVIPHFQKIQATRFVGFRSWEAMHPAQQDIKDKVGCEVSRCGVITKATFASSKLIHQGFPSSSWQEMKLAWVKIGTLLQYPQFGWSNLNLDRNKWHKTYSNIGLTPLQCPAPESPAPYTPARIWQSDSHQPISAAVPKLELIPSNVESLNMIRKYNGWGWTSSCLWKIQISQDVIKSYQISTFMKPVALEREESSTSGSAASAPGCNFTSTNQSVDQTSTLEVDSKVPYISLLSIIIIGWHHHPYYLMMVALLLPLHILTIESATIINHLEAPKLPTWSPAAKQPAIPPWCCPEPTRRCPRMPEFASK